MNFWQSMAGMVEVELVSADLFSRMTQIAEAGIPVSGFVCLDGLTAQFRMARRDWCRLAEICEKRGDRLKKLHFHGLYWNLLQLTRRPVLVVGMGFLFALMVFLPTRILFVRVEGNARIPARQILAAAEDCGLSFGASRAKVRSEKLKNALLSQIPELQWAGVNTSGCTATVNVREKPMESAQREEQTGVCSIAAARDGVILSATASRGNLLCREGEAVKQGQVLISGYTDCGLHIRAEAAQGEIYAQTIRRQTVVTPTDYAYRVGRGRTRRIYSLILGKKRIKFTNTSGISDSTCDRIYSEKCLTLPGGFRLPLALAREDITEYPIEERSLDEDAQSALLRTQAESVLKGQMIAGRILEAKESLDAGDGFTQLTGIYRCREMIGIPHREEIGEYHGKTG